MKVLIDSGYGRNTPGKCSLDGRLKGWTYTRGIADKVVAGLRYRGGEAERIVKEGVDIPPPTRCRQANKVYQESGKNTILISIHCNAVALGIDWLSVHGWSISVSNNAYTNDECLTISLTKSATTQSAFVRQPMSEQLFWTRNLAIYRGTICPSVLAESFFQDNKEGIGFLLSPGGKQQAIQIHIDGILSYLKTIES